MFQDLPRLAYRDLKEEAKAGIVTIDVDTGYHTLVGELVDVVESYRRKLTALARSEIQAPGLKTQKIKLPIIMFKSYQQVDGIAKKAIVIVTLQ